MIFLETTPEGVMLLVESRARPRDDPSSYDAAGRYLWTPYIARITGRHPVYRYDRVFLGRRVDGPQGEQWQVMHTRELQPVDMLIIRDDRATSTYRYQAEPMRLDLASPIQVERWITGLDTVPIQATITGPQPLVRPTDTHRRVRRLTDEEE